MKERLTGFIDDQANALLAVSHEIHAHPELAFREVRASALLADTAERFGISIERGAYGLYTAFEGHTGAAGGPNVAVLAEYDALPGIGHACGHNLIATAALGAALALHEARDRLPGRVTFLGTPAEEKGGGKEVMVRAGAFDRVDAALMIHPAGVNLATMPCICVAEVQAIYHGKAAHASAMPHRWHADFPFLERQRAAISGWTRQFWQGSHDHRGVPDAPGRVVTLVQSPSETCLGMAYRVAPEVFAHLDHREKNGHERFAVPMRLLAEDDTSPQHDEGIVYIAPIGNHAYLGAAPLAEMASQIRHSAWPSGRNIDYLTELADALRALRADDPHIFELESAVLGN